MQNSSSTGPHQGLLLALAKMPLRIGLAKDPAGLGAIEFAYLQIQLPCVLPSLLKFTQDTLHTLAHHSRIIIGLVCQSR